MNESGPQPLRGLREKSPEQLHAQAEAYAEMVLDVPDQAVLVPLLEELATVGNLNELDDLRPEIRAIVEQHRDTYVNFLRTIQQNNSDLELTTRIEFYRRYQDFKPQVRVIQAQVDAIVGSIPAEAFADRVDETIQQIYEQVATLPGFVELSPNSAIFGVASGLSGTEGGGSTIGASVGPRKVSPLTSRAAPRRIESVLVIPLSLSADRGNAANAANSALHPTHRLLTE